MGLIGTSMSSPYLSNMYWIYLWYGWHMLGIYHGYGGTCWYQSKPSILYMLYTIHINFVWYCWYIPCIYHLHNIYISFIYHIYFMYIPNAHIILSFPAFKRQAQAHSQLEGVATGTRNIQSYQVYTRYIYLGYTNAGPVVKANWIVCMRPWTLFIVSLPYILPLPCVSCPLPSIFPFCWRVITF